MEDAPNEKSSFWRKTLVEKFSYCPLAFNDCLSTKRQEEIAIKNLEKSKNSLILKVISFIWNFTCKNILLFLDQYCYI